MARFPCAVDGQRIVGKAAYLYPTVYIDNDQFGERQRLCAEHCQSLLTALVSRITNNLERGCCVVDCKAGPSVQASAYAYCTVYLPNSDRSDFGGPVCAADLGAAAAMMRVDCTQRG